MRALYIPESQRVFILEKLQVEYARLHGESEQNIRDGHPRSAEYIVAYLMPPLIDAIRLLDEYNPDEGEV